MKFRDQNEILKQLKELVASEKTLNGYRTEYGYKYRNGVRAIEEPLCIRVFVDKKKNKEELGDRLIPDRIGFFYTDVLEIEDIQTPLNPVLSEFMEKLKGGAQIVNSNLWNDTNLQKSHLGTLGCLVLKNNEYYGLTAQHVLYGIDNNGGNDGEIFQPANTKFIIGKATNAVDTINSGLDCAIFKTDKKNIDMSQSVYDIEGLIISNKNPLIGAEVHKYGTATKKTYGLVDGIGINDFKFTIGKKNVNDYPLSNKGDSGAIWILDEGKTLRGVGLHVEGIRGVFATASSLVAIFRELKIGHIFQSQIT